MLSTLMAPLKQAFSSDSSLQSGLPLQKSSFSRHSPSPQDNLPSGQMGSSFGVVGLTTATTIKMICICNLVMMMHELRHCLKFEEYSDAPKGMRSSVTFPATKCTSVLKSYLYTSRQSPSVSKRKYSSPGRSAHTSSISIPSTHNTIII
uniref:Uncharacterized protein n=1 Tax=Glossina brevipalpis TaxID=37001 RepID=A0A1A9WHZ1_9MUSC